MLTPRDISLINEIVTERVNAILNEKDYGTMKEVADALNVSRVTAYKLKSEGKIKRGRNGRYKITTN